MLLLYWKKEKAFPIREKLNENNALIEKADEVNTIVMKNKDIKIKQF
jgi:hypothetical protein